MKKISTQYLDDMINDLINKLPDDDHNFQKMMKEEQWELGVDEAGRGPVLGPMVYACCMWPIKYRKELASSGFDDSKKLTEQKREVLFEFIKKMQGKYLDFEYTVLTAEYLSETMLAPRPTNLNEISKKAALNLIQNAINKGFHITNCYIDTVGSKDQYRKFLEDSLICEHKIQIVVKEKADSEFPVVSAASICAKVPRDMQIVEIATKYTDETGSGYPGDPNTKKWLKANFIKFFGYAGDVRFSWNTITALLESEGFNIIYDIPSINKEEERTFWINGCNYPKKHFNKVQIINYKL